MYNIDDGHFLETCVHCGGFVSETVGMQKDIKMFKVASRNELYQRIVGKQVNVLIKVTISCQRHCRGTIQN